MRTLENKIVLVTGGAGFIGSHLSDRLLREGVGKLIIVDNFFLGSEDNIQDAIKDRRTHLYREDAEFSTSMDYIFAMHEVDAVFNCATKALNYSFVNPSNAFSTNVSVALNLLELQRKSRFRTLCHFSTSEVYGSAIYEPMDEKHPRNPTTTYAAGKAAADLALESYAHMFGLDAFIVRPFNNYGPRQNHLGPLAGVIPLTAWRILSGMPPEIHGDGKQSRDFIHVQDTVDAVVKLFRVLPAGESVNISTDNQVAIGDLVSRIATILASKEKILFKPARQADVLCHNASNEKVCRLIDYSLTDFESGLRDTLDWYKERFTSNK